MTVSIPPSACVMIIGAAKSGTTSLFHLLRQHPAICPSRTKEPEYFSDRTRTAPSYRYDDLYEFDPGVHRLCLEASTDYTKFPEHMDVPQRIKEYGLEPFFIYAVRNPLERVESQYNYLHHHPDLHIHAEGSMLNPRAIHASMYFLQLREFLRYFPDKSRYRIVDFRDIVSVPETTVDGLLTWLGLEAHSVDTDVWKNRTRPPTTLEAAISRLPTEIRRLAPASSRLRRV